MEFTFDVNKVLLDELTLIRNKDIGPDRTFNHYYKNNETEKKINLSKIIDKMGTASSKAQGLRGAITSSLRLKSSNHHLYIMKDSNANNGLGCVIGMIKVGFKHLFLIDRFGKQHECQPLCVLDFYVEESKQRNGYGRRIFTHMLQSEHVSPGDLAIDRPSVKFTNFLARHYALDKAIPQVNNFVVYDSFFRNLLVTEGANAVTRHSAPLHRKMISKDSYPEPRSAASATTRSDSLFSSSNMVLHQSTQQRNQKGNTREQEDLRIDGKAAVDQPDQSVKESSPHTSKSDTMVRNFSRHSARQSSRSFPSILVKTEGEKGCNNKKVQFDRNLTVHTLPSCESNESLSNTSRNMLFEPLTKVQSSSTNESGNYTIDKVIAKINSNKMRLGTSWNVFGVPSNLVDTSNPYASARWKSFPR